MKIVLLDGNQIKNISDLHETFASALGFPGYYGRNLDALHDALTDITEKVGIIIVNVEALTQSLGAGWDGFLELLADVEGENIAVCFDPFDELEYVDGGDGE